MFCVFESPGQLQGKPLLLHAGISSDNQIKLFSLGVPIEWFNYFVLSKLNKYLLPIVCVYIYKKQLCRYNALHYSFWFHECLFFVRLWRAELCYLHSTALCLSYQCFIVLLFFGLIIALFGLVIVLLCCYTNKTNFTIFL